MATDITGEEKQIKEINFKERYLIRGDKAKTEDGWFERDRIYSKVELVIPKMGYVMRFLSSPWGTVMLVGLALIPFVYSAFIKKRQEV